MIARGSWWRRVALLSLAGACGPSVGSGSSDHDATGDDDGASEGSAEAGASASSGRDDPADPTAADVTGSGATTGDVDPELDPFEGAWICEGGDEVLYLEIDGSDPPTGRACRADGSELPAPQGWLCAEMSPHPLPQFWVLLQFDDGVEINLLLAYEPETDELAGMFTTGSTDTARCTRYEA